MYYEERQVDGEWWYRGTPTGEWRKGRLEMAATPLPPASVAPVAVAAADEDALNVFSRCWKLDGDYMRCRFCDRPQLTRFATNAFPHASDCDAIAHTDPHPWLLLAELLRPLDRLAALAPSAAVVDDAMVERACIGFYGPTRWLGMEDSPKGSAERWMRDALTAALSAAALARVEGPVAEPLAEPVAWQVSVRFSEHEKHTWLTVAERDLPAWRARIGIVEARPLFASPPPVIHPATLAAPLAAPPQAPAAQGDAVCNQHRPGAPCLTPNSCRSNGCDAVERELFPAQAASGLSDAEREALEWLERIDFAVGGRPAEMRAVLCAALRRLSQQAVGDGVLQAEIGRLNAIINTPHADDFLRAVSIEAEHQRQRWANSHDAGKEPSDWFWLIGYLAGKALNSHKDGNTEKAEHHIITTAAACANWHRAVFGNTDMRPGIDGDAALAAANPAAANAGGGFATMHGTDTGSLRGALDAVTPKNGGAA